MDEKRTELISRAIDDDLSSAERAAFEGRLTDDAGFAAEYESMRDLRRAVARAAGEMEPPAALDAVIKPLIQGTPTTPRRVRPAFRWLGAAAAAVLGVTVTLEVARRNPTPTLKPDSRPRVINQDEREIFELAPLPTAVPDPNRPLGATDQLLEEEPEHPAAPEPRALEIIGPLTDEEHAEIADPRPASSRPAPPQEAASSVGTAAGEADSMDIEELRAFAPDTNRVARKQRASSKSGRSRDEGVTRESRTAAAGKPITDDDGTRSPRGTIPAALIMDGIELWAGQCSPCAVPRWTVLITVEDGVVVTVETAPDDPLLLSDEACLLHDFVGTALGGITDGRHFAEVILR